jgi:hypothetical protein
VARFRRNAHGSGPGAGGGCAAGGDPAGADPRFRLGHGRRGQWADEPPRALGAGAGGRSPAAVGRDRRRDEYIDAIKNLLDLAERFEAASAGPRLAEREAERVLLQARLQELTMQQEAHQATISLEMVRGMLTEMHGTLTDGNLQAKRALLSKVVHKVVMSATGAELVYTFPLGE